MVRILFALLTLSAAAAHAAPDLDAASGKSYFCESGDSSGKGPKMYLDVDTESDGRSHIVVLENGRSYSYKKAREVVGEVILEGLKYSKTIYQLSQRRDLELYVGQDADDVHVKLVRSPQTEFDALGCQQQ